MTSANVVQLLATLAQESNYVYRITGFAAPNEARRFSGREVQPRSSVALLQRFIDGGIHT